MSDWLSRFRELKKSAERPTPGNNSDDSNNSSTERGSSGRNAREAKAIVPFVTGGRGDETVKTFLNAKVEGHPDL